MALAKTNKSVTKELLKLRKCSGCTDEIQTGFWYDGFTKVKTIAATKKIPFIAVWTNGDKCGFSTRLEKCFLDKDFIAWQKSSGCIFWLGTSNDANKDDGYQGSGFKWIYQDGKIREYPFVRIYWPAGNLDKTMTGNELDRRSDPPSGTKTVLNQLKELLKNWKVPAPKPTPVPPKQTSVPPAPQPTPTPEPVKTPSPEPVKKLKVRFNPKWTKEKIDEFRESIKKNGGHCPCQVQSQDTICMCKDFKDTKKDQCGLCICELYERYEA